MNDNKVLEELEEYFGSSFCITAYDIRDCIIALDITFLRVDVDFELVYSFVDTHWVLDHIKFYNSKPMGYLTFSVLYKKIYDLKTFLNREE